MIFINLATAQDVKVGTYRSRIVPRIGEMVDTTTGAYRVVDVWHDVRDDVAGENAFQTHVRVIVDKLA